MESFSEPQVIAEIGRLTDELNRLRAKAEALADEYDREPRLIASGAVASMLREWVQG